MFLIWTEVCHQIFGVWELQTFWKLKKNGCWVRKSLSYEKKLFTNGVNMDLPQRSQEEKNDFGKEKVLDAAISKKDYADSLLGHDRNHYDWFPLKKMHQSTVPTSFAIFHLINWMILVFKWWELSRFSLMFKENSSLNHFSWSSKLFEVSINQIKTRPNNK